MGIPNGNDGVNEMISGLQVLCFIHHIRAKSTDLSHIALVPALRLKNNVAEEFGFQLDLFQNLQFELAPNHN